MTERKQKWLARSFFGLIFSAGPVILIYYLTTVHIYGSHHHNKVHVAPFWTHSLMVLLAVVVGWGIALFTGLLLIAFILFALFDSKKGLIPKVWEKTGW